MTSDGGFPLAPPPELAGGFLTLTNLNYGLLLPGCAGGANKKIFPPKSTNSCSARPTESLPLREKYLEILLLFGYLFLEITL
jgi:hypothetical protein